MKLRPAPENKLYRIHANGNLQFLGNVSDVTFNGYRDRVDVTTKTPLGDSHRTVTLRYKMRLSDTVRLSRLFLGGDRFVKKSQKTTWRAARFERNRRSRLLTQLVRQGKNLADAHANMKERFCKRVGMPFRKRVPRV
jgi:hypothetical protein